MTTLREFWESYHREVIPPTAPDVQVIECRRAFMAGAQAMLLLSQEISVNAVDLDEGAAGLDALEEELNQFCRDVLAGRA